MPRQPDIDDVPPQYSVITRHSSMMLYGAGTGAHQPCGAPCTIPPSNLWREEPCIVQHEVGNSSA